MQNYGQPAMPQTKQAVVANQCPIKCGKESAVLVARPPVGSVATWWSRCQRCLCYWETSPAGKVLVVKVVPAVMCCPDCLEPTSQPSLHVCASKS